MQNEHDLKRSDADRDRYRALLKYLTIAGLIAVALCFVLLAQLLTRGEPNYFATTTTGRVIPLTSLSEPVVTSKYIVQWASAATRSVLNLNFDSYQGQLQQSEGYFTASGWQSLRAALNSSGMLNTITSQKLDASAIVSGDAVILDREVIHGRYTWRLQLPVLVTYTSASTSVQAQFIVTMNVQRVPVLNAEKGLAISDFEAVRNFAGGNNNG